jgi:DNA (cytosine-5)-methyltransferase 1
MGRKADILAINHWEVAIQTHSANNDGVLHLCESVDHIDPTKVVPGQELDLLWASPSCTHHSVARGGRPRCDQQRAPAWIIPFWLENLKIKRLIVENVPEFQNWGPLDDDGRPIKEAKGETFKAFIAAIRSLGYTVEWRVLNAANYGDPTIRRRLFIQAIKGMNRHIHWPNTTHAESPFNYQGLPKWIPARNIIDHNLHGDSIFRRKHPLAPATLRRIEHGIKKFWQPYAEPFLIILRGTGKSRSLDKPLPTETTSGTHFALIEPFLINNYGQSLSASLNNPLNTVTGNVHTALIEPGGEFSLDIRFRMLQPHELAVAQGFPRDYKFCGTKTDITKQIGNAVPVNLSRELAHCCLMTEVA